MSVLAAILISGCESRPRAPALRNEPVYQNNVHGFRFLAPEGWIQHARADIGTGKVDKERLLVEYQRQSGGKGASFQASLADLPASIDLAVYLAGPAFGAEKWTVQAPKQIDVGGSPAVRYSCAARVRNEPMTREVVCFRRGERVYFFSGLFAPDDAESRDHIRRAVDSVIWKK
jgi:hypothetical protein